MRKLDLDLGALRHSLRKTVVALCGQMRDCVEEGAVSERRETPLHVVCVLTAAGDFDMRPRDVACLPIQFGDRDDSPRTPGGLRAQPSMKSGIVMYVPSRSRARISS
jgi:hypothetical protein